MFFQAMQMESSNWRLLSTISPLWPTRAIRKKKWTTSRRNCKLPSNPKNTSRRRWPNMQPRCRRNMISTWSCKKNMRRSRSPIENLLNICPAQARALLRTLKAAGDSSEKTACTQSSTACVDQFSWITVSFSCVFCNDLLDSIFIANNKIRNIHFILDFISDSISSWSSSLLVLGTPWGPTGNTGNTVVYSRPYHTWLYCCNI